MQQSAIAKLADAASQPTPEFPVDLPAYDVWTYDQPENLAVTLITDLVQSARDVSEDSSVPYEPFDTATTSDWDIAARAKEIDYTLFSAPAAPLRRQGRVDHDAQVNAAAVEALIQGPLWDPRDHQRPQPLTSDALDEARTHFLATAAASLQGSRAKAAANTGPMWETTDVPVVVEEEPVVRMMAAVHTLLLLLELLLNIQ